MPDEIKTDTEVSKDPSGPVITTKSETTEVLDGNGKSISSTDSPLSKIFDKIADGSSANEAVKEVMQKPDDEAKENIFAKKEVKMEKKEEEPVTEVVVEKKAEQKVETKAEPEKEEEVAEADLQVLPHDKPKTAQRIAALLKKSSLAQQMAEDTKREADAKAKRVQELEEQLKSVTSADPLTNEKVRGHLEELAMYKRRYELETSPEIKEKFDNRVTSAEDSIQKTLLARGAPESLVNKIKEAGGWLKFIDSDQPITLSNGKEMTASEIADKMKSLLPHSEQRKIEALELEQVQAQRDKETYFNEESKKAKEYFANKENETKQQEQERKQRFEEATKVVGEWKKRFHEENEWLKEKQIDAKLTPEQRAKLEDHNKHAKQLNDMLEKRLATSDINGMLEVLVDSIKYHQERRNLADVIAENQKLKDAVKAKQDELDRYKKAGSPVSRSGSLASGSYASSSSSEKEKTPPSLEAAFEMLESGKSIEST